jgi:ABC-type lipoprotein export system ATPase subunit
MIKGIGKEEARAVVLKIMHSLRLENVTSNEETKELSGGERQRLAFIRAITPTFTVLFGDEPTGNLDPFLSEHLMEMLKKKLKDHDKSVIVVSHNIELSLKYADMIIVITSTGSQSPCTILEENIFRKHDSDSSWVDNHSRPVPDIDQKIFTLISTTPGL